MHCRKILLGLSIALLAGCAARVPLQQAQIAGISRDTSSPALEKILGNATITARTEVDAGGTRYLARSYNLQTGTRSEMTMICTPACMPIFVPVPVLTQYVVVQRLPAMSMHAWGTLEALSKDPDTSISAIMPTVKARLEEEQRKAK